MQVEINCFREAHYILKINNKINLGDYSKVKANNSQYEKEYSVILGFN